MRKEGGKGIEERKQRKEREKIKDRFKFSPHCTFSFSLTFLELFLCLSSHFPTLPSFPFPFFSFHFCNLLLFILFPSTSLLRHASFPLFFTSSLSSSLFPHSFVTFPLILYIFPRLPSFHISSTSSNLNFFLLFFFQTKPHPRLAFPIHKTATRRQPELIRALFFLSFLGDSC